MTNNSNFVYIPKLYKIVSICEIGIFRPLYFLISFVHFVYI